jgi:hypothetical protein
VDAAITASGSKAKPKGLAALQAATLPARGIGVRLDPVSAAVLAQAPLRALLIQSALLAEAHAMGDDAHAIRMLVFKLGVNQALFNIARAILLLHRGHAEMAAQVVEREVLLAEPTHELGRAVLICAWRVLGRGDWSAHANALLASTRDARVHRLLASGG